MEQPKDVWELLAGVTDPKYRLELVAELARHAVDAMASEELVGIELEHEVVTYCQRLPVRSMGRILRLLERACLDLNEQERTTIGQEIGFQVRERELETLRRIRRDRGETLS